eukprot:360637-Chlamydomonas_euryale.AAC.3
MASFDQVNPCPFSQGREPRHTHTHWQQYERPNAASQLHARPSWQHGANPPRQQCAHLLPPPVTAAQTHPGSTPRTAPVPRSR